MQVWNNFLSVELKVRNTLDMLLKMKLPVRTAHSRNICSHNLVLIHFIQEVTISNILQLLA